MSKTNAGCTHPSAYKWRFGMAGMGLAEWCPDCGAIRAMDDVDGTGWQRWRTPRFCQPPTAEMVGGEDKP